MQKSTMMRKSTEHAERKEEKMVTWRHSQIGRWKAKVSSTFSSKINRM